MKKFFLLFWILAQTVSFAIATTKEAAKLPISEGNFEWGGIFGTSYWADPKENLIGILIIAMLIRMNNLHNSIQVGRFFLFECVS